jgi:transposase InsO family protein
MHWLLRQQGIGCSPGLVHRLMAEQGFQAHRTRAWKHTTVRDPATATAHIANHCRDAWGHRCFASAVPGAKTVGDVTSLRTGEGWLYLAVVLDLATRAVIGWSLQPTMHADLPMRALTMAHEHGHLLPQAIFHSDRGSHYTARAFQDLCRRLGIVQSMGATGVCWDNAVAESFFATLKADLTAEVGTFPHHRAARTWVMAYIEGWYNRRRPHTWNHGYPPLTAWTQLTSPPRPVSLP